MTQIHDPNRKRQPSFGFLVQRLARRLDRDMKQRLSEIGVDLKAFANLMLLSQKDGITQRELGRLLEFPEYFTSRAVDVLVEQGFAERRPDPSSRRSVLIYLTPKGKKKAQELPAIVDEVNAKYLKPLDAKDRKVLISLLQRLIE